MNEGDTLLTFEAKMQTMDADLTIRQKAYVEGSRSLTSHTACPYRRNDVIWEWERGFADALKAAKK